MAGDEKVNRASIKAIECLEASRTIDAFCSALGRCTEIMDADMADTAVFAEALGDVLRNRAEECRRSSDAYAGAGRYASNIHIYSDITACLIFAASRIGMCRDATELRGQVEFITDFFGTGMTRPRSGVLTPREAGDLLALVQDKYGLLSAVASDRELDIYLINKSHIRFDSFLLTYKNTYTGARMSKWMIFSLSPCLDMRECNKYHVFLHEMGHILFNAVTDKGAAIPRMFGEVAFLLGLPLYEDIDCPDELFADLFSAVSLNGTAYSSYNPYDRVLDRGLYELLELYFKMLANDAESEFYSGYGPGNVLH